MHNAHQFAAIQPDEAAILAGGDDDIAWTSVVMGVHHMMALRAIDLALQFVLAGDNWNSFTSLPRPQLVSKGFQRLHGNQHSPASRAINDGNFGQCSPHQRRTANGTVLPGWLIENANTIVVLLRKNDSLAVVALKALHVRFEPHGSAAGGTVHWGFPHSAQNFAR